MIVIEPGVVRRGIWDEGASGAGRYADTDYAEPLARFGEYAHKLAKNGFSPERFGRFVREVFEKRQTEDQVR